MTSIIKHDKKKYSLAIIFTVNKSTNWFKNQLNVKPFETNATELIKHKSFIQNVFARSTQPAPTKRTKSGKSQNWFVAQCRVLKTLERDRAD